MSEEFKYPLPGQRQKSLDWNSRRIKALREYLQLTQRQMADELQVRQQTISEWETGIHTPHRSTQKILSMVAERAGFDYSAVTGQEQESGQEAGAEGQPPPPAQNGA